MHATLAIPLLPSIGFPELVLLALVALLLFGKRLPEVGRSLGRGIVEFRKGLQGIEDEVASSSTQAPKLEDHRSQGSIPDTQARPSAASPSSTVDKP